MLQNIDDASDAFYKIEDGLLRREPTLSRWKQKGYHMAHTNKWYGLQGAKSFCHLFLQKQKPDHIEKHL